MGERGGVVQKMDGDKRNFLFVGGVVGGGKTKTQTENKQTSRRKPKVGNEQGKWADAEPKQASAGYFSGNEKRGKKKKKKKKKADPKKPTTIEQVKVGGGGGSGRERERGKGHDDTARARELSFKIY